MSPAAKAASNGRVVDLDAARAARAEIEQKPVTVKFGGKSFELPPELPAHFSLLFEEGRTREALEALLGDQIDAFFALTPSVPDVNELLRQIFTLYGASVGELSASDDS